MLKSDECFINIMQLLVIIFMMNVSDTMTWISHRINK